MTDREYTTDRIHVLRGREPVVRRPTGHVEDLPNRAAADDLITSDPAVMGGRRIFRGTRVPVEIVFGNLEDGMTIEEIPDECSTLNRDDVMTVVMAQEQ